MNAITSARAVTVAFDINTNKDIVNEIAAIPAVPDFYDACMQLVKQNEGKYAKGGSAVVPDVTAKTILCTGRSPYQIYSVTVTTVMSSGKYIFSYVNTLANFDNQIVGLNDDNQHNLTNN